MHTEEPREVQGVELGYDPRDIDLGKIIRITVYFFIFALVFFGGGALYYIYWGKIETSQRFDARKPAIQGPKVQGNIASKTDIMAMRQRERELMTSYKDLGNGKWRIPVDTAMAKIAERGITPVTSDEAATSPGNTIKQNATGPAGEASSTTTSPAETAPVPTPPTGSAGQP